MRTAKESNSLFGGTRRKARRKLRSRLQSKLFNPQTDGELFAKVAELESRIEELENKLAAASELFKE